MDEQVNLMVSRYGGAATASGVKIYALDNEPDLWSSTHPRIHPNPIGAQELITRSTALAKAVKAVDPAAQVFGYESYGFQRLLLAGRMQRIGQASRAAIAGTLTTTSPR